MSASMMRSSGFWTWQIDTAAADGANNRLAMGSGALYALGALLMVAALTVSAPAWLTMAGGLLVMLSVAASLGVVGKVLMRRRHSAG